jgi:hypothetical protein
MQTDDCIYFGMLLVDILNAHGEALLGAGAAHPLKVSSIDYRRPEAEGLLPDRNDYRDFEAQFRPASASPTQTLDTLKGRLRTIPMRPSLRRLLGL